MGTTTFSGPVVSNNGFVGDVTGAVTSTALILPTSTAALLGDAADAINTTGKVAGKAVVDLATGLIYTATGDGAADDWVASDGTTSVTPA